MIAPVERISKVIFYPCKGMCLEHVVALASSNNRKERQGIYNYYEYQTNKYSDTKVISQLSLNTNDYLVIKLNGYDKNKVDNTIYLSYPHLNNFITGLKNVYKWFYDDKNYKDLFLIDDDTNKLVFNSSYNDLNIVIDNLIGGKAVKIIPSVIEIGSDTYEGIIFYLNDLDVYVHMTIFELENFYRFLFNFDLYNSSLNLISIYQNFFNSQFMDTPFNNPETLNRTQPSNVKKQTGFTNINRKRRTIKEKVEDSDE